MAERGIVFGADSVRSILAGEKLQTRRLVRIDDTPVLFEDSAANVRQRGIPTNAQNVRFLGSYLKCDSPAGSTTVSSRVLCPYGAIGDRLYVKETWMELYDNGNDGLTCLPPSGDDQRAALRRAKYRADGEKPEGFAASWKSPRYMPRWASRITLEVTEVRVQRLQEISEEDAKAEGVEPLSCVAPDQPLISGGTAGEYPCRLAFAVLWDTINGDRASWASNPFVWALSFKVHQ